MEIVCPKCRKPFVQAVRQQGILDRLLHWAYVHPYGCKICRHRFYVMQWGLRPAELPMNSDQYRMRPVRIKGKILYEQGHREGDITELSLGGCIIELPANLLEGTMLGLRLEAFEEEPPIIVEAAIVRSALGTRAETEFLRMAKDEEGRLNRFVTSLWLEGTQIARNSGRWKPQSIRST